MNKTTTIRTIIERFERGLKKAKIVKGKTIYYDVLFNTRLEAYEALEKLISSNA